MLFFGRRCDFCRAKTRDPIVVLGRRYCARCAAGVAPQGGAPPPPLRSPEPAPPKKPPPDAPIPDRRIYPRFPPPPGAALILKPSRGLAHLFGGNVVRQWLDVSLGGLRVIVAREIKEGEVLEARIIYERFRDTFDVSVKATHVKPSEKHPGFFLAGFEFVNLSGALRTFLANAATGFKFDPPPSGAV